MNKITVNSRVNHETALALETLCRKLYITRSTLIRVMIKKCVNDIENILLDGGDTGEIIQFLADVRQDEEI